MVDYIRGLRAKVGHDLLLTTSVTIVVYDDANRVLAIKHAEGDVWVLPGGGVEPFESLADAAVREMWEETGLLVEPVRLLGVYGGPEFQITYRNGDQVSYQMMAFEARVVGGALHADGEETKAIAYLSQAELTERPLPPWMQTVLPHLFPRPTETRFQPPTWQPPRNGVRKGGMPEHVRQLRQKIGHDLVLTPSVLGLIFDNQGRLLLQKRADNGRWSGPAGAIDPNESPSNAIVREAWEETGVLVTPTRVLSVFGGKAFAYTYADGDQIVNYGIVFAGRVIGGTPSPDGFESTAVDFFPLSALPLDFMSSRWQKLIANLADERSFAAFEPATWQPA